LIQDPLVKRAVALEIEKLGPLSLRFGVLNSVFTWTYGETVVEVLYCGDVEEMENECPGIEIRRWVFEHN
jgi:hypothetical protein